LTYKLSYLNSGEWVEHSFPAVFSLEATQRGGERVVTCAPGGDPLIFQRLLLLLEPPYILLYVLHTPRGEAPPGRYQSPELTSVQFLRFLERFEGYLRADGRFDLWGYSASNESFIVWDRHNRVFAYGRSDESAAALRGMGFEGGEIRIPSPHSHHFRSEFDAESIALLEAFDWTHTPLRPEDEQ
jgi:hypothetical protein